MGAQGSRLLFLLESSWWPVVARHCCPKTWKPEASGEEKGSWAHLDLKQECKETSSGFKNGVAQSPGPN
ncbi:Ankyrin Repeat Domain-Containing Protein 13C [Manis pentadactyla]|nr:Ankyrin Repeat Domain-Containing Protein 13C [Manis pentadactyla]